MTLFLLHSIIDIVSLIFRGKGDFMRKINIFLASSIVEFASERMEIENFIRNRSDEFEESYNIKLQPLLCENFDDAYTKTRKQEEYNQKIRESEFCFFIFFTKVGEYTREEFEVAREQFEKSGKPKIYTYFKVVEDGQAEQSIYDFMDELDKSFGHYYGSFLHIDTVKLRIMLALKLQEMDFLEIKAEGGKCVIGRNAVMSLDNVSEFANNELLGEMKKELEKVEEEYYLLKSRYEKDNCDNEFYSRYSEIASKRQNLIDEIEGLQNSIFNVSLRMVKDDIHGEISARQKKAYILFEKGDYEGCMAILDSSDIDNEFLRGRKALKEKEISLCRKYIKEHKTAIDVLRVMKKFEGRFNEIEERYEKIIPVIFEMEIEFETAFEYTVYLIEHNKEQKAILIAEKLKGYYEEAVTVMSQIYTSLNEPEKAEKCYLEAIEIAKKHMKEKDESSMVSLALSYNNIANFYENQRRLEDAEKYYLDGIEILEKVAENDKKQEPHLAVLCDNLGMFYTTNGKYEQAHNCYEKAVAIFELLASTEYDEAISSLVKCYNNVGFLYEKNTQFEEAEKYYLTAIELSEKLAGENPDKFGFDLATSYNSVGLLYKKQSKTGRAARYYKKAIAILERLVEKSPEKYGFEYVTVCNNMGALYVNEEPAKTEEYFEKSLKVLEKLAENNHERYAPDLVTSCNYMGVFCAEHGQRVKAKAFLQRAMDISKVLVDENPKAYNPLYAQVCFNCGAFYGDKGMLKKALSLAKTRPDHILCQTIINGLKNMKL